MRHQAFPVRMKIVHLLGFFSACFLMMPSSALTASESHGQISNEEAQIAISLSAIAYLKGNTHEETFILMADALKQSDLPTKQQWGLVWGPVEQDTNLMYIAQGPRTQYGRKYAVVIRGTVKKAGSILEDFPGSLTDLPWHPTNAPEGTKISGEIAKAVNILSGMTQKFPSGKMVSALDFLKSMGTNNQVIVTGHSLGGCLASVVPLWLRYTLTPATGTTVKAITFAGQTAGNAQFAQYFQETFKYPARYANSLDVVPKAFNYDSLESIKALYPNNGPKCDFWCKGAVKLATDFVGHTYYQPTNGVSLPGKVYDESGLLPFIKEIEAQHDHIYYMYLTGIPLRVIQGTPLHPGLGAGWWPPGHK